MPNDSFNNRVGFSKLSSFGLCKSLSKSLDTQRVESWKRAVSPVLQESGGCFHGESTLGAPTRRLRVLNCRAP